MKITDQQLVDKIGKANAQIETLLHVARKRAVAAENIQLLKSIDTALCCAFSTHRALLEAAEMMGPQITPFSGGGK